MWTPMLHEANEIEQDEIYDSVRKSVLHFRYYI